MKHVFVINPCAGKRDVTAELTEQLKDFDGRISYEIYVTQGVGDATTFVARWCEEHRGQAVRFYACGGDGTLNEVVCGMMDCAEAEVACVPCGSGNDYIKYYGTQADFMDLGRLVEGTPRRVDVMTVNDRCSINVSNMGFDAQVCKTMNTVRRKPIIGGSRAYTTGILANLFTSRSNYCQIKVDGQPFFDGKMLLCTLSNGKYVGGSYQCARNESRNDDGLLEVSVFLPMSILKLATLIGHYADGSHFSLPNIDKLMKACQATEVELATRKPAYLAIDGELVADTRFKIVNRKQAVRFVVPQGINIE